MTEELESFGSAPEAGQPSGENVQPDAAQPEAPQYVTRTDLEQFSKTLEESLRRMVQSTSDKRESRIEKKLAEVQRKMQEQGVQMTPQMVETARTRLVDAELQRMMAEDDEPTQPVQDQPNPVVTFVKKQANAICDELGVQLEPTDPEYRMLALTDPDPGVFLESVRAAATAKRARTGAAATPSGARAPMAVGGKAERDLYSQYQREVNGARPGSEAVMQIRMKYRKMGLNV